MKRETLKDVFLKKFLTISVVSIYSLFCFSAISQAASSEIVKQVQVRLISEKESLQLGASQWLGVEFSIEPGWHLYWKNPGDSGAPPKVEWTASPGFVLDEFRWPTPKKIEVGPLVNFGYENKVLFLVPTKLDANYGSKTVTVAAKLNWLVCSDVCVPGKVNLELTLPVGERDIDPRNTIWAPEFERTQLRLPDQLPVDVLPSMSWNRDEMILLFKNLSTTERDVYFFPETPRLIDLSKKQEVRFEKGLEVKLHKSQEIDSHPEWVRGVLAVGSDSYQVSVPVQARQSLWLVLLFAFLGGLILNFMPCVFPVLSIKIISLTRQEPHERTQIRVSGYIYTLGVLASMWILSGLLLILRAGGETVGWGFQLQSPSFVAFLCILFFILSLNFLGVFEFSSRWMGFGHRYASRGGLWGSFFTGVLAVLSATPCTAPFMGTALGFAISQTWWIGLLIFTFLGVGLSSPYLILSLWPTLATKLPRPGRWMEGLRRLLSLPMLGTVLWLLWVLSLQIGSEFLMFVVGILCLIAFGVWSMGRVTRVVVKKFILWTVLFTWATGVWGVNRWSERNTLSKTVLSEITKKTAATSCLGDWPDFEADIVSAATSQHIPVFIDFTAAWCVTCKVNEAVAFTETVKKKFQEKGVLCLKADWTNEDERITQELTRYGRSGVPLYLLYTGDPLEAPRILPQILTEKILIEEIDQL